MRPNRLSRFVRKWFTEWDSSVFGRASDLLAEMIETRPEDAWERILALVANAKNQEALGWVGAGPLEDLLSRHGQVIIDRVEAMAVADPKFVVCLAAAWGWSRFEPCVYERVQRIVQTVEVLLLKLGNVPTGIPDFELWVPQHLTLRGQPVTSDVAMAVICDKIVGMGFIPDGFTEAKAGRIYRYKQNH